MSEISFLCDKQFKKPVLPIVEKIYIFHKMAIGLMIERDSNNKVEISLAY